MEFAVLDHNTDVCGACSRGGDLLCCDKCPRAFHVECLGVNEEDLPDGDWVCGGCDEDAALWAHEPLLQWAPFPLADSTITTDDDEAAHASATGATTAAAGEEAPTESSRKTIHGNQDNNNIEARVTALERGLAVVELLLKHDFAQPFAAPIDPVGLGLSR